MQNTLPHPAYRDAPFATPLTSFDHHSDGTLYLASNMPLNPIDRNARGPLRHWAEATPEALFLAQRTSHGEW